MSNIVKSPSDSLIRGRQYLESPIFYMGNKYKLLKQLMPLFPASCEVFVDLFGGSGVVSMNYHGTRQTIYNEYNINIYELIKLFATHSFEELDAYFQSVVDKYDLQTGLKRNMFDSEEAFLADTDAKKVRYNKFREDYNKNSQKDYRDLWVLSVFSCNHLIRFNTKNEFNASFGSNGNYNDNLKKKVQNGCTALKGLILCNEDALTLDLSGLTDKDFVYCDPPYTNTTAVYNEKRAFGGWTVDNDKELFTILESLDKKGIKWGLSNVFVCRGKKNEHLIKWCEEHNWNVHHLSRNYNPFSRGNSENDEVYICNYDNVEPEDKPITLYHGDCLEIMKDIPDNSIDLIVTDPPYLIKYKTNRRINKKHDFCSEIANDDNYVMIHKYIIECYRILKNDKAMYIFCNCDRVDYFKQELEKAGFKVKNMIIWVKNNWTAGDLKAQFGKQYEIIFLVNKGRCLFNGKRITDVWNFNRVSGKNQFHQNQKPIDLIKLCLEKHSSENDLIFDGFMGSGSTGVACVHTNRRFIGIELEDKYFNIAVKRIEEAKK